MDEMIWMLVEKCVEKIWKLVEKFKTNVERPKGVRDRSKKVQLEVSMKYEKGSYNE